MSKYVEADFVNNERNKSSYGFISKMDIGETIDLAENTTALYRAAKEAGRKISIKQLPNGDIQVKRVK